MMVQELKTYIFVRDSRLSPTASSDHLITVMNTSRIPRAVGFHPIHPVSPENLKMGPLDSISVTLHVQRGQNGFYKSSTGVEGYGVSRTS